MKVELSKDQTRELRKLWFVFGNNGPKHTHHNHIFIQRFLDSGEDWEDKLRKADKEGNRRIDRSKVDLTQECVEEVRKVVPKKIEKKFGDEILGCVCHCEESPTPPPPPLRKSEPPPVKL